MARSVAPASVAFGGERIPCKGGGVDEPHDLRYRGYRAFFFSREEARRHVHVRSPDGEAKFWLEPVVALAEETGLPARRLREMQRLVEQRKDEIEKAWDTHFGRVR